MRKVEIINHARTFIETDGGYSSLFSNALKRVNIKDESKVLLLFGEPMTWKAIILTNPKANYTLVDTPMPCLVEHHLKDKQVQITPYELNSEYSSVESLNEQIRNYLKDMKFDIIIMNPPYSFGNKCISEARNLLANKGNMIVLAPLYCYKSLENYKYIRSLEIVDSTVFTDADITKNLCVVQMNSIKDDSKTYSDYEMKSYDSSYYEIYEWNMGKPSIFKNKSIVEYKKALEAKNVNNKTWFVASMRAVINGTHGEGAWDYEWDHKRTDQYKLAKNGKANFCFYEMPSEKAKDNLTTWWYYKGKKGLSNSLLKGLNKAGGSCEDAIPQIDWESIEENSYWKAGDYDSAVLDVMGLKWNENKDGVVRK